MLRLKKIKIDDTIAEADFYPEDQLLCGHIVVDLLTEEIVICKNVQGYGDSYKSHAMYKLLQMAKNSESKDECLIMWY